MKAEDLKNCHFLKLDFFRKPFALILRGVNVSYMLSDFAHARGTELIAKIPTVWMDDDWMSCQLLDKAFLQHLLQLNISKNNDHS